MAKVQRANRLLTVPDETVEKYLSDGYNLVGRTAASSAGV